MLLLALKHINHNQLNDRSDLPMYFNALWLKCYQVAHGCAFMRYFLSSLHIYWVKKAKSIFWTLIGVFKRK